MKYLSVMLAFLLCHAASAEEQLHDRVVALYAFSPHELSQPAIAAKSKSLDTFWNDVKAGGEAALEDLRKELAQPDAPPFFSYDGAKLLLSLSKSKTDRSLALVAIGRADIRDLQPHDYFLTIHSFAVDELDTTEAAFKILSDDKFQVFIPEHSLTLDQDMCLDYLLLPTKESFYLEKAERRLFVEKSVTAQKSLLSLLADTVTKSGDEAIARFAASTEQPQESRDYANEILAATKRMQSAAILGASLSTYDALKQAQRELFARVSDEAVLEWDHLRIKIRRKGPR
jgi:hypothetical protein